MLDTAHLDQEVGRAGGAQQSEFTDETFEHYGEHTAEIDRFAASDPAP